MPDNSTENNFSDRPVNKPVPIITSIFALGLVTAVSFTTILDSFSDFKSNLASLQEANYAAVHTANKVKENIEIPIQNLEPKETNRVIVKFKDEAKIPPGLKIAAEKANLEKAQGLKHVLTINGIDAQVYEVSEDDTASEVVNRILSTKKDLIEYAEVDMLVPPTLIPNDPYYPSAWHLPKIHATTSWDSTQGEGFIIATLDSGVDTDHPDLRLAPNVGYNFYENNSNWSDVYGHGTKVAGASTAFGNNALGVTGVAYNALVMPIRVTGTDGWASHSAMAQGMVYAADNGSRVANMSFRSCYSTTLNDAAGYLRNKGGLAVISAGNDGIDPGYPQLPNIICVSATGNADARASWSSYGAHVDLAAPGVGIYTTVNGGGYGAVSGTSFSAPITAGVIALILTANPELTASEAETILFSTADDIGTPGWDMYYGHGRVNAAKAVAAALATKGTLDVTPPTTPTNLSTSGLTSNSVNLSWSASTDDILVTGYNLYRNGTKIKTVSTLNTSDSALIASTTYSYTVSAIDKSGNESPQSNPLSITTPDINFAISSHSVPTKTTTGATVAVTLTKPGTVTVKYGTTNTNLNSSVQSTTSNTNHSLAINNLNQRTTYYYQVVATDSTGNVVTSAISSFKTSGGKR